LAELTECYLTEAMIKLTSVPATEEPELRSNPASQDKIRIFHSIARWLPRTENWIWNLLRSVPSEFENHVFCEDTENLEEFSLPNIHSFREAHRLRFLWDLGLRKLKVRRHLGFLTTLTRQHNASVLHSHFGNHGWTNLGFAKRSGIKHLVTFYGFDVNYLPQVDPAWGERYRELFAQCDRVLCEGPHMAGCLVRLGCPESKLRVQHLGVCVDEIEFRPRAFLSGQPLRVLIAASFQEKKGIPYALEALGRLRQELQLQVTIIGDANSEIRSQLEKKRILAAVGRYGLQSRVNVLGYQTHQELLAQAYQHHIFLSPSVTASDGDTEGGAPVTIIEMAATGMPIVSTAHCDIPEVIQHGITGMLAPERDVDALVQHLRWLVSHPTKWEAMLRAGRQRMESEFNVQVQGKRLALLYAELTGPTNHSRGSRP
jgi:colanic acid/amylovoran/stewartan biosynthesis glycosyltransferase WcaL/AmsK/CpsK